MLIGLHRRPEREEEVCRDTRGGTAVLRGGPAHPGVFTGIEHGRDPHIVEAWGWRWVFWVNVVLGVVALATVLLWAPDSRATKRKAFDPVGQVVLVIVLASLVFVIIQVTTLGWTSPLIVGMSILCVASLVSLILYERRREEALIPFELFASRSFTSSILTLVVGVLALGAAAFALSLYLQNARGLSPAQAGLATLPLAAASMIAAPLAGRFVGRGLARAVLLVAAVLITLAGVGFWITADDSIWLILVPFGILGFGFGALNDPVNVIAISDLPDEKAGLAASLISMGRQVGQVLGVAIAGALLSVHVSGDATTNLDAAMPSVWILLILAGLAILAINLVSSRSTPAHPALKRTA